MTNTQPFQKLALRALSLLIFFGLIFTYLALIKDISDLINGTAVKYGQFNMCVSSVETSNFKMMDPEGKDPAVTIHFRLAEHCGE